MKCLVLSTTDISGSYQVINRAGFRGERGGEGKGRGGCALPPFFVITCFFCNPFEELETVLFEVELIINNAPLTYFYRNTIETRLTSNQLLFGRQLLYSSNTHQL